MSQLSTVQIDTVKAQSFMERIAREMDIELPELLKNETRLLCLELIRKTPPTGRKTEDDSVSAYEAGKQAIQYDLNNLFTHVDYGFLDRIGSEYGITGVNCWITTYGGLKLNLQWEKLDPTGSGMYEFHQRMKNNRGRIPKGFKGNHFGDQHWKAKYVVTEENYVNYGNRTISHLGKMKSGWLDGFDKSGGQTGIPEWIRRHGHTQGSADSQLSDTRNPSITIINHAPNIGVMAHIIDGAVKTRQVSLMRRMRRITSGIKDSVSAGGTFGGRFVKSEKGFEGN